MRVERAATAWVGRRGRHRSWRVESAELTQTAWHGHPPIILGSRHDQRWKPVGHRGGLIEDAGRFSWVRSTPEGLRLNTPAGHLDPGESPEEVRARSVKNRARVHPHASWACYLARFRRPSRAEDVTAILRIAFGRHGRCGPSPAGRWTRAFVRSLWMTLPESCARAATVTAAALVLPPPKKKKQKPPQKKCIEDYAAGKALSAGPGATPRVATLYDPEIR
jgi:hypothetical protein